MDAQLIETIKKIKADRAEREALEEKDENVKTDEKKDIELNKVETFDLGSNRIIRPEGSVMGRSSINIRSDVENNENVNDEMKTKEANLIVVNPLGSSSRTLNIIRDDERDQTIRTVSEDLIKNSKRVQSSKSNKFNKNDSGYSESATVTANNTPTTVKTSNLDLNNNVKINSKNKRMPDVESIA